MPPLPLPPLPPPSPLTTTTSPTSTPVTLSCEVPAFAASDGHPVSPGTARAGNNHDRSMAAAKSWPQQQRRGVASGVQCLWGWLLHCWAWPVCTRGKQARRRPLPMLTCRAAEPPHVRLQPRSSMSRHPPPPPSSEPLPPLHPLPAISSTSSSVMPSSSLPAYLNCVNGGRGGGAPRGGEPLNPLPLTTRHHHQQLDHPHTISASTSATSVRFTPTLLPHKGISVLPSSPATRVLGIRTEKRCSTLYRTGGPCLKVWQEGLHCSDCRMCEPDYIRRLCGLNFGCMCLPRPGVMRRCVLYAGLLAYHTRWLLMQAKPGGWLLTIVRGLSERSAGTWTSSGRCSGMC